MPEFADAFFENEAQDKEKYKGFTHKDDRFKVGGEAKISKPIDEESSGEPVVMKKRKFGGQVRKRLDNWLLYYFICLQLPPLLTWKKFKNVI